MNNYDFNFNFKFDQLNGRIAIFSGESETIVETHLASVYLN
jgi:hypothetical protein